MLQKILHSNRLGPIADISLALFTITIVVTMVIGINPMVADVLVALNISIAVTVLFACLLSPSRSALSGLPYILLLATLFRLALNVSTTRLILSKGDAGDVIAAFGEFATGGDFVVGAIVFLILVLVQFIVVAKGAERAAELDARFELDAMPSDQMSIDGDLSRGLVSAEETRRLRSQAARDRKATASLEGAMKFIKGDAIAGIVISVVNIIGGLIIGMTRENLGAAEALERYGKLTIGDGLVSQIPALLLSVAAGLVTTKVCARGDDERRVGADLFGQILAQPAAVLLAGLVLLALAISTPFTGLPVLPFACLGLVAFAAGGVVKLRESDRVSAATGSAEGAGKEGAPEARKAPVPRLNAEAFVLEIHEDLARSLGFGEPEGDRKWAESLRDLRVSLSTEYGIELPSPKVVPTRSSVPEGAYAFRIYDGHVALGYLPGDALIAIASPSNLRAIGVDSESFALPGSGATAASIAAADAPRCREAGHSVATPTELLLHHVRLLTRRHARDLATFKEIVRRLDDLRLTDGSLAQAVIPKLCTEAELVGVVKELLGEQVPIRDLRGILEALASLPGGPKELGLTETVEKVRRRLRRLISSRAAVKGKRLEFYLLGGDVEEMIRDHALDRALPPCDCQALRSAVAACMHPFNPFERRTVLRVPDELRRAAATIIGSFLPEVMVLADSEVSTEIHARFLGFITVEASPAMSMSA